VSLANVFLDPENDPLTLSSTNLPSWMTLTDSTVTGKAPSKVVETHFDLTATDVSGNSDQVAIYVYANAITGWNDTVIFFVMFIFYVILAMAGIVMIIIFRSCLMIGRKPPIPPEKPQSEVVSSDADILSLMGN
jgi:hypothetical protein